MTDATEPADFAARFHRLIRRHGPMPVARYMGESNASYYSGRDPLGTAGDFITAPEISQMFGEMAGLWLADVWQRAGRPVDAIYVELGPGRGSLARDALRAMASQGLRPAVHLVEASPALRRIQAAQLPEASFHDSVDTLPEGCPILLLANEFFDALPVRQLVRTAEGWRERMVALDEEERFIFVAGQQPMDAALPEGFAEADVGTIVETSPAAAAIAHDLARRLDVEGGAALIFDYGALELLPGSTLQAVHAHRKIGVFDAPGESDLTAHVDFAALRSIAARAGLATASASQGDWLRAMGIEVRAEALARRNPECREDITAALERLVGPDQMGDLFKVFAMSARDWPRGTGFATR